MRFHLMMAALGAALMAGCGDGNNGDPDGMVPVVCAADGPLAAGCSELLLTSSPGGAAATLDGVAIGTTPTDGGQLFARRPFGIYTLELALDGYEPYAEEVALPDGMGLVHAVTLIPTTAAMGTLNVSADVLGGTVVVDDVDRGVMETMPMGIDLPEGMHRVAVRLDGHISAEPTVEIRRGETSILTVAVGRDLTGTWDCSDDVDGRRMAAVVMASSDSENVVSAAGLALAWEIGVSGLTLYSTYDMVDISGNITPDARMVNWMTTDRVGTYTTVCTR